MVPRGKAGKAPQAAAGPQGATGHCCEDNSSATAPIAWQSATMGAENDHMDEMSWEPGTLGPGCSAALRGVLALLLGVSTELGTSQQWGCVRIPEAWGAQAPQLASSTGGDPLSGCFIWSNVILLTWQLSLLLWLMPLPATSPIFPHGFCCLMESSFCLLALSLLLAVNSLCITHSWVWSFHPRPWYVIN